MINIRPLQKEDVAKVVQLMAQPDMDGGIPMPTDKALQLIEEINSIKNHTIYVAEDRDEIVGTFALIMVQHLSHHGARSAIIEDVVVRSDRQRQGLGLQMMQFATEVAKKRGCYKIALSSGLKRNGSHQFYEKLGFSRHGYSFLLEVAD